MQVKLLHTQLMKLAHLLLTLRERDNTIILLRICRIEEIGIFLDSRLDSFMYKCTSNQIIYRRILCRLFSQRLKPSLFFHIGSVHLAEIVVVTVIQETVSHDSAILHFPETRLMPCTHMCIRSTCRMFRIISCIPRRYTNRNISCAVFDLPVPWHISARCPEKSVKWDRSHLSLPGIRYQEPLLMIQKRIPLLVLFIKLHLTRPIDLPNRKSFLVKRNPFEEHITACRFNPYNRIEGIRHSLIPNFKSLIMAPDSFPNSGCNDIAAD